MATTTAVSSQTATATSANIAVADGNTIKVWVSRVLGSGEDVTIIQTDGSSVEVEMIEYDLAAKEKWPAQITPGVTAIMVSGPGTYKFRKSATAVATAVYYDS